jgi:hypothetical protein
VDNLVLAGKDQKEAYRPSAPLPSDATEHLPHQFVASLQCNPVQCTPSRVGALMQRCNPVGPEAGQVMAVVQTAMPDDAFASDYSAVPQGVARGASRRAFPGRDEPRRSLHHLALRSSGR